MVEASNYEPFPKSYALFEMGSGSSCSRSRALDNGDNKKRKAHDNELANGGVNGWAKYTMGFTQSSGRRQPKDHTPAPTKEPPTETSFASKEDRDLTSRKWAARRNSQGRRTPRMRYTSAQHIGPTTWRGV